MDIGKEQEVIVVEPVETPAREDSPATEPMREGEPAREVEPVPA